MKRMKMLAFLLAVPVFLPGADRPVQDLSERVRHELVMLPWLGVFDHLTFQVEGDKVILAGQVNRPTLRSDAERVVLRVAGVSAVSNQIEVLPLSPFDDRVRLATLRALYSFPALQRYGLGVLPGIRILVKNGNVTLAGVVANPVDAQLAYLRAMQVPGVFSVSNQLTVEGAPQKAL
jgi:hyperosmotically inducible periplasmic protein